MSKRIKHTKESVMISAKKFTSRVAWERGDLKSLRAACRLGIYEECCSHMKKLKEILFLLMKFLMMQKNTKPEVNGQ